jgi:ech hydrogenase subunit D
VKYEEQQIIPVTTGVLVEKTAEMFRNGCRLVQIGCTFNGDSFEINYSFDKDYTFTNLRLTLAKDEALPSVSGVYFGAFMYENEIHDLFGVTVTGINIDFKGTLYRTSISYPFVVDTNKEDDTCQNK